ncbi:MAG: M23 family metallopeptidase [Peptococcaceae bacterium]|jgi:murein DD-endopeptidase MepM/ murein hydrolase activator NlpD|nr:M23 family metallopeptidase [Peptococcaceae bacterium]
MFFKPTAKTLQVKRKRDEKLTFMIMGGPGSRIRDIRVSAKKFKICFSLFCVMLIGVGASGTYIVQDYLLKQKDLAALHEVNKDLSQTNETQAVVIEDLQSIAGNMKSKIEAIEDLNSEVRTKVGLEETGGDEARIVAGYTVARGDAALDNTVTGANEELDTLEDLRQELLDMDLRMTRQTDELLYLKDDVEKQLAFEAALPNLWPMEGIFTSPFGARRNPFGSGTEFHQGIDIANKIGTQILAAGDGVVTFAGVKSGWGRMVLINHGYGYVSQYAHCSSIEVLEGQEVKTGDVIANCGNTGRVTGPHLHFGVQKDGEFIDPMTVLDAGEDANNGAR